MNNDSVQTTLFKLYSAGLRLEKDVDDNSIHSTIKQILKSNQFPAKFQISKRSFKYYVHFYHQFGIFDRPFTPPPSDR